MIEVRLDLGGLPVTFLDMAGLRKTSDTVEAIGVARARQRADAADIRVFLLDGTLEIGSLEVGLLPGDVVVRAKSESSKPGRGFPCPDSQASGSTTPWRRFKRSSRVVSRRLRSRHMVDTGSRSGSWLSHCGAAAGHLRNEGGQIELAAVEITKALRGIDFLVGRVDIESVLGEIFASFCIGK